MEGLHSYQVRWPHSQQPCPELTVEKIVSRCFHQAKLHSDAFTGKRLLLTKWKAISAELLRDKQGHQLNDINIEQSISQAMAAADLVLSPFVNSSLEAASDKRVRNLEGIMRRAVDFAFLLFSQPSIFEFQWAAQNGGVVVFPGLQQVVNESGNLSRTPFSEPEVVGA